MTKFEIEEKIVDMLKTVYDPEIPVNIYDLGLIYKINSPGFMFDAIQEIHQPPFLCTTVLNSTGTQMSIGKEIDVFHFYSIESFTIHY